MEMTKLANSYHNPSSTDELTQRNVAMVADLENAAKEKRTPTDRVVDAITGFCGRMTFVWVHVAWFAVWMIVNLDLQVNLLAEQENTKMLTMLDAIQKHLGIHGGDPEISVLEEATQPNRLAQQIEAVISQEERPA